MLAGCTWAPGFPVLRAPLGSLGGLRGHQGRSRPCSISAPPSSSRGPCCPLGRHAPWQRCQLLVKVSLCGLPGGTLSPARMPGKQASNLEPARPAVLGVGPADRALVHHQRPGVLGARVIANSYVAGWPCEASSMGPVGLAALWTGCLEWSPGSGVPGRPLVVCCLAAGQSGGVVAPGCGGVGSGPEQLPGPQIWIKTALPTTVPPALAPPDSAVDEGLHRLVGQLQTCLTPPRDTVYCPSQAHCCPKGVPLPDPPPRGFQPPRSSLEALPLCPQALACCLHRPSQRLQSGPGGLLWPFLVHLPHAVNSRMTGLCLARRSLPGTQLAPASH